MSRYQYDSSQDDDYYRGDPGYRRGREPDYDYARPPPAGQAPNSGSLQVPSARYRPRSVPPPSSGAVVQRRPSRPRSPSSSGSDRPRSRTPLAKARKALDSTFSHSTSGLGVGVIGAIIGGLAAREASEAAMRRRRNSGSGASNADHQRTLLLSTIVGAAAGGLGANALEKRLESNREKDNDKEDAWERKFGKDSHGHPTGDSGRRRIRGRGAAADGGGGARGDDVFDDDGASHGHDYGYDHVYDAGSADGDH